MDPQKNVVDLNIESHESGIIGDVTIKQRLLLKAGRIGRKPIKKQMLTKPMMRKRLVWAKKHQILRTKDGNKIPFSVETYFFVHEERVFCTLISKR